MVSRDIQQPGAIFHPILSVSLQAYCPFDKAAMMGAGLPDAAGQGMLPGDPYGAIVPPGVVSGAASGPDIE